MTNLKEETDYYIDHYANLEDKDKYRKAGCLHQKDPNFSLIHPEIRDQFGYDFLDHSKYVSQYVPPRKIRTLKKCWEKETPQEQLAHIVLISRDAISDLCLNELSKICFLKEDQFYIGKIGKNADSSEEMEYMRELLDTGDSYDWGDNTNSHHVIPKVRSREGYRPNFEVDLDKFFHKYWHCLYLNRVPKEVLTEWTKINAPCLAFNVREKIERMIRIGIHNFYIDEAVGKIRKNACNEKSQNRKIKSTT